jgi:N-acetylgalactosamine kinase
MGRNIASVIMAGGKGTRMRCSSVHKVCFPLGGKPVINRTIETLNRCGINSHFIVVRHLAEQVMQAASSSDGTHYFCYQAEPRGTGNAAKTAADVIKTIPSVDDILVVAGDKVIEESILKRLIKLFYKTKSDLSFIAGNAEDFPSSGRIIQKGKDKIAGILEVPDIKKYLAENKFPITLNGQKITAETLSKVRYANLSVYLFKKEAFFSSLKQLTDNNVQKEEYLTDTIAILVNSRAKITILPVDDPHQVMSFNTPEEIIEIENHLLKKSKVFLKENPCFIRKPLDWLRHLETASPQSLNYFHSIYGSNYPYIENKRMMLIELLKEYYRRYGNLPVVITRAPGRINLMGRHIDHQGGDVNMIALDKDIYCIAGKRNDRKISAHSIEPRRFPDRHFSIDELAIDTKKDWHTFINSSHVKNSGHLARGDWGQYIKAVISRFQHFSGEKAINGMNIMTSSDLPAGGGISSSSALFVSVAEACVLLNNINITPEKFVELCGEGEQYVGTRGGSGDQAAIKYSQKGSITQIGFSPLKKIETVDFPENCVIAIANSQHQAHKTKGARNIYNQRVACYRIGMELLQNRYPEIFKSVNYFRDIVYNSGLREKEILTVLKYLPVNITAKDLLKRKISDRLRMQIEDIPENLRLFPVREVFIYGLAECLRSRLCASLFLKNNLKDFGTWMNISHNGDRIVQWTDNDTSVPFHTDYSDRTMDKLIEKAGKGSDSTLVLQPGSYRCSIPEIDRMVDISLSVNEVIGAQISGAGLGGCIMVMVKEDSYEKLKQELLKKYYDMLNLEPDVFITYPVEGSGSVFF